MDKSIKDLNEKLMNDFGAKVTNYQLFVDRNPEITIEFSYRSTLLIRANIANRGIDAMVIAAETFAKSEFLEIPICGKTAMKIMNGDPYEICISGLTPVVYSIALMLHRKMG